MTAIEEALDEAQGWLDQKGVVGVGEGEEDGAPVVDVWVATPDAATVIPDSVRGVRVRVRDSGGEIVAG